MKIFYIHQHENKGEDKYECAVVIAKDLRSAYKMHPSGMPTEDLSDWTDPSNVNGICIGVAAPHETRERVVCASFFWI